MRKYRGLLKDGGWWIYGYIFKCEEKCFIIRPDDIVNTANSGIIINIFIEVIPETVGQYTGLDDKKCKEIYDGTILKDPQGNTGRVFYNSRTARYLVNWHRKDDTWETNNYIEYGEVVGDIHTTPELLEVK